MLNLCNFEYQLRLNLCLLSWTAVSAFYPGYSCQCNTVQMSYVICFMTNNDDDADDNDDDDDFCRLLKRK